MELQHLQGDTYALATEFFSVGLHLFHDQSCLLIDSGANQTQGQHILRLLNAQGWTIAAIFNTHAHADHTGGNHYIQKKTGCRIYASEWETAFIQQPLLTPYSLFGSYPLKLLQGKFLMAQPSQVSDIVKAGTTPIKGRAFEILDLGGHTLGHLGIRTPDNVIFAGDSLIAPEILSENPFLYLADPEQQLTTLANFPGDDEPLLYLSHGGRQDNISAVISTNYQLFFSIVDTIKNILAKPLPLEDIIREIIRRQGLDINRNHYYRLRASVSAFLAYLCNHRQTQAYSGNQGDVLFKLIK